MVVNLSGSGIIMIRDVCLFDERQRVHNKCHSATGTSTAPDIFPITPPLIEIQIEGDEMIEEFVGA